jgi:hypothetical protein
MSQQERKELRPRTRDPSLENHGQQREDSMMQARERERRIDGRATDDRPGACYVQTRWPCYAADLATESSPGDTVSSRLLYFFHWWLLSPVPAPGAPRGCFLGAQTGWKGGVSSVMDLPDWLGVCLRYLELYSDVMKRGPYNTNGGVMEDTGRWLAVVE